VSKKTPTTPDRHEPAEPEKPAGSPSRERERLAPDSEVFREIIHDMMELTEGDLEACLADFEDGDTRKPLDQVALETGVITADQRDRVLGSYLERRVAEMREMLLGSQLGSYHILEEIASGGMGIVFKARQESPMFTREVAVKFMLAGSEAREEDRQRFISEVKGLAGLSHPFLVPIYDSDIEKDLYYFTMEYIDGWALSDWPEDRELSLQRKVEIARDIALALDYLHENGVIHRDVKPGNIMVDRHGVAKLLDFGIAQLSADARRRVIQAGTPHYMAPEVVEPTGSFGSMGPGSDIYALGAVLYRMLIGKEVFEGDGDGDVSAVFDRTLHEPASFPSGRHQRLDPELQRIISRCLRKRVVDRYLTAGELADDLDRFVRRRRFLRPLLMGAGGLLMVVVFLALTFGSGQEKRVERPTVARVPVEPFEKRLEEVKGVDDVRGERLQHLFDELRKAVESGKGWSEQVSQFYDEEDRCWDEINDKANSAAQDEKKKAEKAAKLVPVGEDTAFRKIFRDADNQLYDATSQGRPKSRYECLIRAQAEFAQAVEEAKRQDDLRREREEKARRAEVAELEKPLAAKLARLRNEEKYDEHGESKKNLEEAETLLNQARKELENGKYSDAKESIQKASAALNVSVSDFQNARDKLDDDWWSANTSYQGSFPRWHTNKTAGEVQRWWEDARAAHDEERLDDLKQALAKLRGAITAADEKTSALETDARTAIRRVLSLADDVLKLGKAPLERRPLYEQVKSRLQEGAGKWRAGDYLGTCAVFEDAAALLKTLLDKTTELTRGMAWTDGGLVGDRQLPGFWIDVAEVSVEDYRQFLLEEGAREHEPLDWNEQLADPERPVVGVSFESALAYASSRGKTIPTESMWRYAARGGSKAPAGEDLQGDERVAERRNVAGPEDGFEGLAPAVMADEPEAWKNPLGCFHFQGNAAEWVRPDGAGARSTALLMGGCYLSGEPRVLSVSYAGFPREEATRESLRTAGFRCALKAFEIEPEFKPDIPDIEPGDVGTSGEPEP
jgi:tRNA A-37 threonylcarbamoyl transferase component Bud32